jgi:23S rRNA G2445 N2-methylase RlmL
LLAHVVPGLEEPAWEEIAERVRGARRIATWTGIDRRAGVLLVAARASVDALPSLRLVEDVFAVVATNRRLAGEKAGLRALQRLAADADIDPALALHREATPKRARGRSTFRVIVRASGEHGFRRIDAQRVCEGALAQRFPRWRLVDDNAGLEFWLQIIGAQALLSLRLSGAELRQRAYRAESRPAALRPTVAHALVRLAGLPEGDLLLDPMCGTGTVLAEAAGLGLRTLGGELDERAARAARRNLGAAGLPGAVALWDAARLPLHDDSVDAVACNLPWGRQQRPAEPARLYSAVLGEARRVVRRDGRIVLLVAAGGLRERLVRTAGLETERSLPVIVRGADAVIVVLRARV